MIYNNFILMNQINAKFKSEEWIGDGMDQSRLKS